MLLLEDAIEVVLKLFAPHIAGTRDRNAVAVPRGCVFFDVVLHVIVVNVVWAVSMIETRLDKIWILTMRPCWNGVLAKCCAILHGVDADDDDDDMMMVLMPTG